MIPPTAPLAHAARTLCRMRALLPFSLIFLVGVFFLQPEPLVELVAGEGEGGDTGHTLEEVADYDLDEIHEQGVLVVGLPSNSTTYLLHRGEARGFEYEILCAFAESEGLTLKVERIPLQSDLVDSLLAGEVDIIGGRLLPEAMPDPRLAWSLPLYETPAALVQRETGAAPLPPEAYDAIEQPPPPSAELSVQPVDSPEDLAGRWVWARKGSGTIPLLVELSHEVSGEIEVVQVPQAHTAEELVRWVATGQATLSVTDADLARLQAESYENITVTPVLSEPRSIAMAVRANAPVLRDALDQWIHEHPDEIRRLYRTYYVERRGLEDSPTMPLQGPVAQLSEYDGLFREHSAKLGLDWRLLASQAYQESRFQPAARSWAGASGLMQLMPATARELGVTDPNDPAQSVQGAVNYLAWLDEQWKDDIIDPVERLKFVLASYNAGMGHVHDAQRLAEAHDQDDGDWSVVAFWMLQLSKQKYYDHPVVRHGYCRGLEPVLYVEQILARYEHYRHFVES